MLDIPFYDSNISYEENYDKGPFGTFLENPGTLPKPKQSYTFLGIPVDVPFGIPAGPLLNGRYVEAAWNWGFSLATYKTVRGNDYPCHPAPNVIRVTSKERDIRPGETVTGEPAGSDINVTRDGITNSFGVPSKVPDVWLTDVKKTLAKQRSGNVLILSFMGTKKEGMTFDDYVADFVRSATLAKSTGAPVLEVNFSCPNVGKEGLICNDIETATAILQAIKPVVGNTPLLVKIGYFPPGEATLEKLLDVIYANAAGVAAINTIQAKVVDKDGKQALPGSPVRMMSGICGAAIRWAGLEMSERIMTYKTKKDFKNFTVVGVGGVVEPDDYFRYMKLGVDAVQAATGPMWKPSLAVEIRKRLV